MDRVSIHADFATVLAEVHADFERSGKDEWENNSLERYLDALAALGESLPQVYANRGEVMPEQPTWQMVARLLVRATGYE